MSFCPVCENAMEPDQKETTSDKLIKICRICQHQEEETDITQRRLYSEKNMAGDVRLDNIVHLCDDVTMPIHHEKCKNTDDNCQNEYLCKKRLPGLSTMYICPECKAYWIV